MPDQEDSLRSWLKLCEPEDGERSSEQALRRPPPEMVDQALNVAELAPEADNSDPPICEATDFCLSSRETGQSAAILPDFMWSERSKSGPSENDSDSSQSESESEVDLVSLQSSPPCTPITPMTSIEDIALLLEKLSCCGPRKVSSQQDAETFDKILRRMRQRKPHGPSILANDQDDQASRFVKSGGVLAGSLATNPAPRMYEGEAQDGDRHGQGKMQADVHMLTRPLQCPRGPAGLGGSSPSTASEAVPPKTPACLRSKDGLTDASSVTGKCSCPSVQDLNSFNKLVQRIRSGGPSPDEMLQPYLNKATVLRHDLDFERRNDPEDVGKGLLVNSKPTVVERLLVAESPVVRMPPSNTAYRYDVDSSSHRDLMDTIYSPVQKVQLDTGYRSEISMEHSIAGTGLGVPGVSLETCSMHENGNVPFESTPGTENLLQTTEIAAARVHNCKSILVQNVLVSSSAELKSQLSNAEVAAKNIGTTRRTRTTWVLDFASTETMLDCLANAFFPALMDTHKNIKVSIHLPHPWQRAQETQVASSPTSSLHLQALHEPSRIMYIQNARSIESAEEFKIRAIRG